MLSTLYVVHVACRSMLQKRTIIVNARDSSCQVAAMTVLEDVNFADVTVACSSSYLAVRLSLVPVVRGRLHRPGGFEGGL